MKLLPIIDDTPVPHDYPRRLWWYEITHRTQPNQYGWFRSSGAARYYAAKRDYPNNAIYYAGGYRARRIAP